MTQSCFNSVAMKSAESGEILIYEQIGEDWWTGEGVTAKGFDAALKAVGSVKHLDIRINSPGGSTTHGFAIYESLMRHPAKKTVHIDGLAASMATLIAMVGDEIHMSANALFMIHEPQAMASGTADDLVATATVLESISANAVKTYAARTGRDPVAIKAEMQAETWFTAEQAKEAGYVTHVTARKALTAHFDPVSQFSKAPAWVQDRLLTLKGTAMADTPPSTPEKPAASEADIAKMVADAKAKGIAEATARATEINAKCALAGLPNLAQGFIEDASMSVADVQTKLFDALCKANKPVGDDGAGDKGSVPVSPNAKYENEYAKSPEHQARMSREDFVSLRRFQDGLDPLFPSKK